MMNIQSTNHHPVSDTRQIAERKSPNPSTPQPGLFERMACIIVQPDVERRMGSLTNHILDAGLKRLACVNPEQVYMIGCTSGSTYQRRLEHYRTWSDAEHSPFIRVGGSGISLANPNWFLDCEAIPYDICQRAVDRFRLDFPQVRLYAYTAVHTGYLVTNGHDPDMQAALSIAMNNLQQPAAKRWISGLDGWCPDAYVWDPGTPIGSAQSWNNTYHYVYRVSIWSRHLAINANPDSPTPVIPTLKLYRGVAPDHQLWSKSELARQEQAVRDSMVHAAPSSGGGVVYWDYITTPERWTETAKMLGLLRSAVGHAPGTPTMIPAGKDGGG